MTQVYDSIVGQPHAIAQLSQAAGSPVHAYLFVGQRGVGKHYAALAFAAQILCNDNGCGKCEVCTRAVNAIHPDVNVIERVGASISVDQAREVVRIANRSPLESDRQIVILTDFHLVEEAAPALLKTIEEPPVSTVFIIEAEFVPASLSTIASRCVNVEFQSLTNEIIYEALIREGIDEPTASKIAVAARGSLTQARQLAHDAVAVDRYDLWTGVPERLNGKGATVVSLTNELLAAVDAAANSVENEQEVNRASFSERAKESGMSATDKKEFEARQKRELRRARTDELRSGLLTLAHTFRDRAEKEEDPAKRLIFAECASVVQGKEQRLLRNPNESLMLDALLVELDKLIAVN